MTELETGLESTAALNECERVLRQNWRTGRRDGMEFSYTCPSPGRYPWQWYWDSCLAAVAWRHFEGTRARAELQTLLEAADEDGFIGHTIFWDRPVSRARRLFYNVGSRRDRMTATIQPPLLAWTWKIAVGDPAAEPAIAAHHAAIESRRDLDGDGLLWIIQPDESGLDAAPEFEAAWPGCTGGLPGFSVLVQRNRRLNFDAKRVRAAGRPLVCHVLVNVLHGLSRLALGQPSITPALVERLYDPAQGLFFAELWPAGKPAAVATWSALAPLALPDLPQEIGRRLVEEHLLDPARFWLEVAPPSVAASEPSFSTRDRFLFFRRYWRGPTWVNAAWLIWLGLLRLGYRVEADELSRRLLDAVRREGLREYYQPHTGTGMGARDFAWSALVSEFVASDPRAAASYLSEPTAA
jgi:hypothetical protein